ncbi:MAG: PHP domain-containing protein [Thermotogota bacterium]
MKLDMHIHSKGSDGTYDYKEIIDLAKKKELEIFSITDHDNLNVQKEACEYSRDKNIKYIPGVEISTEYPNMLDVLGYGIDIYNDLLNKSLKEIQDYRIKRNDLMVEKLNSLGLAIDLLEVRSVAGSDIIGRPHIARVMMNKGYVNTMDEAFSIYLGNNKKAFVPKIKLKPENAIEIITKAGGKAVLAHPKYITNSNDRLNSLIKKFKDAGLWGIEAYYSKHNQSDIDKFKNLAKKYDLNITAGSDFHGDNKPEINLGMEIQDEYLNESIKKLT